MKVERKFNIQKEMNNTNSNSSNTEQKLKRKDLIVTTKIYDKKGKLVLFHKQGIFFDINF